MQPRDIRALLFDVVAACETVQSYVAGRTVEAFLSDGMLRDAVERQLLVVGEAVVRIKQHDPLRAWGRSIR